jgi:hypothetical protein
MAAKKNLVRYGAEKAKHQTGKRLTAYLKKTQRFGKQAQPPRKAADGQNGTDKPPR